MVQIADTYIAREMIACDGPDASRQARTAGENGGRPFGKTPESLRDCARFRITDTQDRINFGIIEASGALRRNVQRASGLVWARTGHEWKYAIDRGQRGTMRKHPRRCHR